MTRIRFMDGRSKWALGALALALGVVGCSDSSTATAPGESVPNEIRISAPSLELTSLGETVTFSSTAFDVLGREVQVPGLEWSSLSPDILRSEGNGVFRSTGVGIAAVEASSATVGAGGDKLAARANVVVNQVGVRLEPVQSLLLFGELGGRMPLTAYVVDALGSPLVQPPPVTWAVDNPEVLALDAADLVRAVADGTTRLTAQAGAGASTFTAQAEAVVSSTIRLTVCPEVGPLVEDSSTEDCADATLVVRRRPG